MDHIMNCIINHTLLSTKMNAFLSNSILGPIRVFLGNRMPSEDNMVAVPPPSYDETDSVILSSDDASDGDTLPMWDDDMVITLPPSYDETDPTDSPLDDEPDDDTQLSGDEADDEEE